MSGRRGGLLTWWRRRRDDERGALSAALPIFAISLLVLAGLGIDGSRQLNTRGQAVAFAEEASRDGALGIYPGKDDLVLNETEVKRRVGEYCAVVIKLEQVTGCDYLGISAGGKNGDGTPDTRPLVVSVRVTTQIQPTLLGIVYNKPLTASAVGRARPIEGVTNRLR